MQYISIIYLVVHTFSSLRSSSERTLCIRPTEDLDSPDPAMSQRYVCVVFVTTVQLEWKDVHRD